jgi:hypothetical protein
MKTTKKRGRDFRFISQAQVQSQMEKHSCLLHQQTMDTTHHALDLDDSYESNCTMISNNNNNNDDNVKNKKGSLFPPYTQQEHQGQAAHPRRPHQRSTTSNSNDLPWTKTSSSRKNDGVGGRTGHSHNGGVATTATAVGAFPYTQQYPDASPSPALHGDGVSSTIAVTGSSNRSSHHNLQASSNHHQNPSNHHHRKMLPSASATTSTASSSSSVSLDTLLDRLPTVTVAMSSPPDFVLNQVLPKLQAAIQVKHEEIRVWRATTAHSTNSTPNSLGWKLSTAKNLVEWIWTLMEKIQSTSVALQSAVVAKNNRRAGSDENNVQSSCSWSRVCVGGLVLLQKTMELWMESCDDCLLYAVLVHEKAVVMPSGSNGSNNKSTKTKSTTLLEFLSTLATNNNQQSPNIISATMACLATAWRCLDGLQWYATTSSNTANSALENTDINEHSCWWMQPQHGNSDKGEQQALSATTIKSTAVATQQRSGEYDNDGTSDWPAVLAQWALDTWLEEAQPATAENHLNFLDMDEHQHQQPDQPLLFQQEELRLAVVTILDQLLRHGHAGWLHTLPDNVYFNLSKTLIAQAQRLIDPHMPYTCYTRLSLASLALLATLERKASLDLPHDYVELLESTALVDFVSLASFPRESGNTNSENHEPPRWTQTDSLVLQPWTLPILRQWNHTGRLFVQQQRNHHHQPPQNQLVTELEAYTSTVWSRILSSLQQKQSPTVGNHGHASAGDVSLSSFRALLWLHTEARSIARSALSSLVKKVTAEPLQHGLSSLNASPLLAALLHSIRPENSSNHQPGNDDNTCNLGAVLLLHMLLEDRRTAATHDKLSRAIWNAIDERFVQDLLHTTLAAHMSNGDRNRPALLALLDTLQTILPMHPQISWNLVDSFSAQHLEALVQLVTPRNCRIDLNQQQQKGASFDNDETFDLMESDESTPPANNLSRLDEKSICVEIEDETKFHGIDETVRMAAASVLATFLATASHPPNTSSHSGEKDRINLIKSRMSVTLTVYVADLQLSFCLPHQKSCMDLSRRRLRLLTTLAQSDCEEFVTGLIFATETHQRHAVQDILQEAYSSRKQVEMARVREERLVKEKESLARQLKAQSASYQKEKTMFQQTVRHNSKQLIQVHATERANAEKQAKEMSRQLQDLERLAAQALNDAMTSKEAEASMKASLENTASRLKEKEEKLQLQERMLHERQQEVERLARELSTTKTSLSGAIQKTHEMREHIESQEETLVGMEKSQSELQESLELLFADMVGLAQLYEHQEEQLSNSHHQGTALTAKLEQKLAKEKARNDELERRQEQMEYENEVLSKKYAHVREKLDEERSRQAEEASQQRRKKRTGPVSYINQLHNNNTSIATTASGATSSSSHAAANTTSTSRASGKSCQQHHRHGKENASSSSSTTQQQQHRQRSRGRSSSKSYGS